MSTHLTVAYHVPTRTLPREKNRLHASTTPQGRLHALGSKQRANGLMGYSTMLYKVIRITVNSLLTMPSLTYQTMHNKY